MACGTTKRKKMKYDKGKIKYDKGTAKMKEDAGIPKDYDPKKKPI